jgi:hypothetical protein
MRLNDATPADWDAVKKKSKGEGYPERRRVEGGYWTHRETLEKAAYIAKRFKEDKEGNKVYQPVYGDDVVPGHADTVNEPVHYNQGALECIDYIEQQLTAEQFRGYLTGNSIKYLHRYQYKNGVEDLKKQVWYTERLIRMVS